jgi:hypothetical protein
MLFLTRTADYRFAVKPSVSPPLLATCRQIHSEARQLLYLDNEVTLAMDIHDRYSPVINESRLPQQVLEKLQ